MKNPVIVSALLLITTMIGIGTVVFHTLEEWSWIEAFYFTVVTLSTVGYGDLHPTHDLSRLAAAIYILIGVGIFATTIGYIARDRLSSRMPSTKEPLARLVH